MWGICPGRPHRDQRLQLLVQGLRRADIERVHQRPGDLVAEPVQHPSVSTTTGPAPAASASGSAGVVVPSAAFRLGPDVVAVCRAGGGPGRIHLGGRSRRPRLPPRHTPSAQPPRAGKQRRQARQSSAHQSPCTHCSDHPPTLLWPPSRRQRGSLVTGTSTGHGYPSLFLREQGVPMSRASARCCCSPSAVGVLVAGLVWPRRQMWSSRVVGARRLVP